MTAIDWLDNELQKEMRIENTPVRSYVMIPLDTYMNRKTQAKNIEQEQRIISDDEITFHGASYCLTAFGDKTLQSFEAGAKWYREQLKQRK